MTAVADRPPDRVRPEPLVRQPRPARSSPAAGCAQLVDEDGIRGVTSNPTIFEKAMAPARTTTSSSRELADDGLSIEDIYWELVARRHRARRRHPAPVYDELDGADGFVSVEVSPRARARHRRHDRAGPGAVRPARPAQRDDQDPGDAEGLPAIEETIAAGINVNVTLIFSLERYDEVIEAYLAGLERLARGGRRPRRRSRRWRRSS